MIPRKIFYVLLFVVMVFNINEICDIDFDINIKYNALLSRHEDDTLYVEYERFFLLLFITFT